MKKVRFEELENTLTRTEMKSIMAGSGGDCGKKCHGADANCGSGGVCFKCSGPSPDGVCE